MNLRLSPSIICLRLTYDEVLRLLSDGKITEALPFFDGGVSCSIDEEIKEISLISEFEKKSIEILVNKNDVENILLKTSEVRLSKKNEFEINKTLNLNGALVEFRLEIDFFSVKGKKK